MREATWELSRLHVALGALAPGRSLEMAPSGLAGADVGVWIEEAARWLGAEAEPLTLRYATLSAALARLAAPVVVARPGPEPCFLVIVGRARRGLRLLHPDLSYATHPLEAVAAYLSAEQAAPVRAEVEAVLEAARVAPHRRERARAALVEGRLGMQRTAEAWLIHPAISAPARELASRTGLYGLGASLALAYLVHYALWLLSWGLLGRGALEDRLDLGWILAWGLMLLTLVPLQAAITWLSGLMSTGVGRLLRERLMAGILRLSPDEVKERGAGQWLGRTLEVEALELMIRGGGLMGLFAVVEVPMVALALALATERGSSVLATAPELSLVACGSMAWLGVAGLFAWRALRQRRRWTLLRRGLTHDLVERMTGHRTRLAQEAPERWHEQEDQALAPYVQASVQHDGTLRRFAALVPTGWLAVGMAAIGPGFVTGRTPTATLAVALGAVLLGYRAFRRMVLGLSQLMDALAAWDELEPLWSAGARPIRPGLPRLSALRTQAERRMVVLDGVGFRYPERERPILADCSLEIGSRDRILLEGPSGGGKSTLGAVLSGARAPSSGLLLVDGLDVATLGSDGWRRRVAAAPQFHANHVLIGTFAFNLLMGRPWPPTAEDMHAAEKLCRELGLGPLLERMPAGMLQMVGETGWQLSHGERSRLYLARALLQGADLLVLDESFGALDPETLELSLRCVLERARALLVIAHP